MDVLDQTVLKQIPVMVRTSILDTWEVYSRLSRVVHSSGIKSNSTCDIIQKKDDALNLLLQHCLDEIKQTNIMPVFSDMKSVCNLLAKEFMNDILKITSDAGDEDISVLQKYLLWERGWIILRVIHKIGVQMLSNGRDLANLLVSLLPFCLKFPVTHEDAIAGTFLEDPLHPIIECFPSTVRSGKGGVEHHRNTVLHVSKKCSYATLDAKGVRHKMTHKRNSSMTAKSNLVKSDDESENETVLEKTKAGKIRKRPRCLYAPDMQAQSKQDSASDEDDIDLLLRRYQKEESSISASELCQLIIDLLFELCKLDSIQSSAVKYLSVTIMPHLLSAFLFKGCDMEVTGAKTIDWPEDLVIYLQRHLLRVIFLACSFIAKQQNGVKIFNGHKVVSQLLEVCQKCQYFNSSNFSLDGPESQKSRMTMEASLVEEVLIGLLICFDSVFQHLPFNPDYISSAVQMMKDFYDNEGFLYLRRIISFIDWIKLKSSDSVYDDIIRNDPIRIFGSFLKTLKVVKVNYIHSMKCAKRKHNRCLYSYYLDHHHDILGVPESRIADQQSFSSSSSPRKKVQKFCTQTRCLVASCSDFLMELLNNMNSKFVRLEILRIIDSSAICCCMQLDNVVKTFVKGITFFSLAVRSYSLKILNKIVLENFSGGHRLKNKDCSGFTCSTCEEMELRSKGVDPSIYHGPVLDTMLCLDSGFSSSDLHMDTKVAVLQKLSKWRPMQVLKDLLYSDNESLAVLVSKHLLALSIKGNPYLKAELFFSLYADTLGCSGKAGFPNAYSSSEEEGDLKAREISKSVQIHCLSAFPYLLQEHCVMRAFLTNKGIVRMCCLLEDAALRAPVLRIFEALIILDQERLKSDENEGKGNGNDSSACPYQDGNVIIAFINELSRRSFKDERSDLGETGYKHMQHGDGVGQGDLPYTQWSLPVMVDMWGTCAKLCLNNSIFVSHFQDMLCMRPTESLLIETLQSLIKPYAMMSQISTETEDSGLEGDQNNSHIRLHSKSANFFMRVSLLESLTVVCGAYYSLLERENNVKPILWTKIVKCFDISSKLEPMKLKVIFDALLSAAMPHYSSVFEYSYNRNISLLYTCDDDSCDEDEVWQLLQSGSEDELEVFMTEHGYEADNEESLYEEGEKLTGKELLSTGRSLQKVFFPSIFRLVVELLVCVQDVKPDRAMLTLVLHRLLQVTRMDSRVAKAMCNENILELILCNEGFWKPVTEEMDIDSGHQTLLVLVQQLAQHSIGPHDFKRILQLFQHSDISTDKLLSVLLTIAENSPLLPCYSVKFPVKVTEPRPEDDSKRDLLVSGSFERPNVNPSKVVPFFKAVSSMLMIGAPKLQDAVEAEKKLHYQEVWGISAIQTSLRSSLTWPPFQKGFSVALWCQLVDDGVSSNTVKFTDTFVTPQHTSDSSRHGIFLDNCLHLVSVGTREKLFEVWAKTEDGSLIFRLTSETAGVELVVQETARKNILPLGDWHHVVISYVEGLDGSTLTGQTTVVIDGWQSHSFTLDHSFSAIKSRNKLGDLSPQICLGHVVENPRSSALGTLSLGPVMFFKGAIESKELCFHLYALGPNCQSISKCDRAEDIFTYAPLLKKNVVLQAKIQYDFLVGLKKVSLDELRNSLLLIYNPKYSREISLYGAVSKGNMSGQLAANLGLTPDMAILTQQPKQIIPTIQGHIRADINLSLEKAVEESGGLDALLFLVAKVYELCGMEKSTIAEHEAEKLQARALRVLFSVVHHSPVMAEEYAKINGNALLSKVLIISRSVVGHHTLKVLMDASTTESLFRMDPQSGVLVLRPKSEALIRDASIIKQLLLNWQLWQKEEFADFVFQGLESLVREDHPHQTFNVKQYQVINIVRNIFKIYQERIQEGEAALPVHVSQRALYIIRSMIGSPPDYQLIIEICDFLLHVHPAANAYINHSRSTFYFTLWWGVPVSPLTKWKQGLGKEKTSTPEKEGQPERGKSYMSSLKKVGVTDGIERLQMASDEKSSQGRSPKLSLQFEIGKEKSLIPDSVCKLRSHSNPENLESQKKSVTDILYLRTPSCDAIVKTVSLGFKPSLTVGHEKSPDNMATENAEVQGSLSQAGLGQHDSHAHAETQRERKVWESSNQSQEEDSSYTSLYEEITNDKHWDDMSTSKRKDLDQDGNIKMKSAANQFDEENTELFEFEKGLITLSVGLLKLLCDTIVIMPDALLEKTFHNSIKPQVFIVLAHHSSPEIRTWIIKVLAKYLEHCNAGYLESFLKMDGFQLLSAQLFQYPTYQEQFEAALSIVLARNFSFEDGLCLMEAVEDPSLVQQSAIQLVLALLGNSTGDLALCHNALNVCTQLFENSIVLAGAMVDAGLIEVLSNMIIKVLEKESCPGDVEGFDESEMLLNDIQCFLCTMAVWEFSASGPEHYQQFEDILNLLKELETREENRKGLESKGVQTLRMFQCLILGKVLELVEQVSEEVSNQSFSIFPRQLSSSSRSLSSSYAASKTSHLIPSHKLLFSLRKPPLSQSLLHQNTSLAAATQGIRLTGNIISKAPPHKSKSTQSAGFYVLSDQPYEDMLALSADSDMSQDSITSQKVTYNRAVSMDVTHRRIIRSNSLLQSVLSIGKRKKLATIPISQNELIDRLKKLLIFATDLAMYTEKRKVEERRVLMLFESAKQSVKIEREFQRKLFDFIFNAFEATLPQERNLYKRTKNVIMWAAKDVIRVQLGRMLSLLLSPEQDLDQKVYAMSYMMMEKRGTEALKAMCTSAELGNDLGYYVYNILANCRSWLSNQQNEDGSKFINLLRGMGFTVPSPREVPPAHEVQEMLKDKCRTLENRNAIQKTVWLKKRENAKNRIFHKFDNTASQLCGHAMETTQAVTQLQTRERNKFVTHIKQTMTDRIQVKKQWQEIVQNLTHERAVWFDKKSYPQSWQLNPTEGPCRVRKRLQRGQLGIEARFLKENYRYKLDAEAVDPPLIYLFEDDHQMADKAPLIFQLHKNKKIKYTSTCWVVSPSNETKGELLIGEDSVFFVADEAMTDANYTQVLLGNKDQLSMTWPYEDIKEIHKRWYQLMDTGLEIFLTSGKTCLLAFKSVADRDHLYQQLMELELPNRINTEVLLDMLSQWEEGKLTNFEYLTHLNKASGRSFNDLMQYPVFPFILKDYTSQSLDLKDPSIYRDLSRPIAVQDVASEERYKNNYKILQQEYERRNPEEPSSLQVAPYHYGSHYSNSGTVLHFLVRLPPFTKMFLNFQDQNFDIPDRTFHNMHTTWRLSSADSSTDVKELIPEFFFLPEFFRNSEGFDLGKRQTGDIVSDVTLPAWCKNNPRLFILVHRQALESDFISQNIHNWIDLVFGYKQKGENAVKAINVFHPATYFGIDVNIFEDQLTRKAIRTMVKTYGQTPKQLFRVPHPARLKMTETDTRQRGQGRHIKGLKWGCYLGSLDMPDPECVWEEQYSSGVASLVPLQTGFVYGISANSCVLAVYSQEKSLKEIAWQAILTWGHPDNIIRIINGKDKPAINFLHHSQVEELTCCLSVPDCRYLFTGGTSGVITMYSTKYNPAKESELQVFGQKKCLYGHTKAITTLVVCRPFSILVSASEDETCIIWDLNRLSYVRSIEGHRSGVKVLAVSDTMGDIASVSNCGMGSCLQLHTVNAEHVATVTCKDSINCLAFSGAPEGVSINVVVGGLSSGIIRIWSSWDLTQVRDLRQKDLIAVPVISVAYTCDSQKLYISSCDGRVMLWDYSNQSRSKQPKFKPFLFPS